jgi:hypothetical protein
MHSHGKRGSPAAASAGIVAGTDAVVARLSMVDRLHPSTVTCGCRSAVRISAGPG